MMRSLFCLTLLFSMSASPASVRADAAKTPQSAAPALELKSGDRVLFVGGTFIEREAQFGWIETELTARFAGSDITFRNLGQSGDTIAADARNLNSGWANFGPPEQGFGRLKKLVSEIKPTVIIANYGMTESFEGPSKLDGFIKGYEHLLDMMSSAAGDQPRLVLVSPNFHEDLGNRYPDPKAHNANLRLYRDGIKDLAERRKAAFVDLLALTERLATQGTPPQPLTNNGIHLTSEGYHRLAGPLVDAMGVPAPAGKSAPSAEQFEKLRGLVVAKNAEFFNYWRPQNDTYILGYRRGEQGRNAPEIPKFLNLVDEKEKEIAAAKK